MRLLSAIFICLSVTAWAQPGTAPIVRPSENIALGKTYTLEPAPDYEHCTEPGDAAQLTDGVYTQGYFWTQPSTVGWQNAAPVFITLDLGAVQPIRGVSVNMAAGVAGVEWPSAIYVLAADEDRQFYEAGELVYLSSRRDLPPAEGYAVHRFWTDTLKTHGRYVAFLICAQPYAFVDEVEVYAGEKDWASLARSGEPVADPKAYVKRLAVREGVLRRLTRDLAELRKKAANAGLKEPLKAEIDTELGAIAEEIPLLPTSFPGDFRAVLPLNPLHQRLFRVQARLWEAAGYAPVTVWPAGKWDALSHLADPPQGTAASARVALMQNEYRAAAVNISNAGQEDIRAMIAIRNLPAGDNPPYITVHEVVWSDTNSGQPVAAALPEALQKDARYAIQVPAGMTRQVWLTFRPEDIPPGEYGGVIEIQAGGEPFSVPLTLKLYPLRFPDKPALHFGGWDYTNMLGHYEVTEQNRAALIAHLREHFVDSPWATAAALPFGEYDASGVMTKEPDTSNFDAWLTLWPDAAQYMVFASVGSALQGMAMDTPEFSRAVQGWAFFWANHASKKGLRPEQLAVLLVDEPRAPEQDAVILAWAKALRAAGTGIRVWEDPIYRDMEKADSEMIAACDVLCPNRSIFLYAPQAYRDYFVARREQGATLDFYSCDGPMRLLDPYRYCRMQAWLCWKYEAKATYFWAFADGAGGSSWNEYLVPRNAYTPLFIDSDSVTAGKHLEACREGIEDFEYFVMLRGAIDAAGAKGVSTETIQKARAMLTELPDQVLRTGENTPFRWYANQEDRFAADRAREQILDMLVALSRP